TIDWGRVHGDSAVGTASMASTPMWTCPALQDSNALPAPSKQVSLLGTPSRLASSRASAGVMPPGLSGVPFASTILPRLIEARSVPVGASSFMTSDETLLIYPPGGATCASP